MATTFARILKYGFQNFTRNGWLSVATVAVMFLALSVFHSLIIFKFLTDSAIFAIQEKIDISAYFKSNTPEDEILKVEKSLEGLAEVKSVEYMSQEQALEIFKAKHGDNQVIAAALQELDGNPLLASLNIKAKDPDDYGKIASYLEEANLSANLEKVTYSQNQPVISRLAKIVNAVENTGFGIVLALAAVAGLVTFNTIRLGIYSNREELGIMRLVGSSNKFIRGPYVVSGIIYGLIAGVLSIILAMPLVGLVSPYAQVFIPEANLSAYFYGNFANLLGYQLMFGIFLGAVSSVIAVRRYLKI